MDIVKHINLFAKKHPDVDIEKVKAACVCFSIYL